MKTIIFSTLQKTFAKNKSYIRLVVIVSPTWNECLHGVRGVLQILRELNQSKIKAYIIWIPVLPSDNASAAIMQASHIRNGQIRHYWNPDRSSGLFFSNLLGLNSPIAWDVYLLFNAKKNWENGLLLQPIFWMHQLDIEDQSNRLVFENLKTKMFKLCQQDFFEHN